MSDEDYCTCNRRVTRELTKLLKADNDCNECEKRLNPDITAPCYYPRQADYNDPRIPLGGARGGRSGSTGELEQEPDQPDEVIPDLPNTNQREAKRIRKTTNSGYREGQQPLAHSDHRTVRQKGTGPDPPKNKALPCFGAPWVISTG